MWFISSNWLLIELLRVSLELGIQIKFYIGISVEWLVLIFQISKLTTACLGIIAQKLIKVEIFVIVAIPAAGVWISRSVSIIWAREYRIFH